MSRKISLLAFASTVALAGLLTLSPSQAQPAAPVEPNPVLAQVKDTLQRYGSIVQHPRYGEVWIPSSSIVGQGWSPYPACNWTFDRQQNAWSYNDRTEWGAIVHHHGRWAADTQYGWMWIADANYGPGHVYWKNEGNTVSWAALTPDQDGQVPTQGWQTQDQQSFANGCRTAAPPAPQRQAAPLATGYAPAPRVYAAAPVYYPQPAYRPAAYYPRPVHFGHSHGHSHGPFNPGQQTNNNGSDININVNNGGIQNNGGTNNGTQIGGIQNGGVQNGGQNGGIVNNGGINNGKQTGGIQNGGIMNGGQNGGIINNGGNNKGTQIGGVQSGGVMKGGQNGGIVNNGGINNGTQIGGIQNGGIQTGGLTKPPFSGLGGNKGINPKAAIGMTRPPFGGLNQSARPQFGGVRPGLQMVRPTFQGRPNVQMARPAFRPSVQMARPAMSRPSFGGGMRFAGGGGHRR